MSQGQQGQSQRGQRGQSQPEPGPVGTTARGGRETKISDEFVSHTLFVQGLPRRQVCGLGKIESTKNIMKRTEHNDSTKKNTNKHKNSTHETHKYQKNAVLDLWSFSRGIIIFI